MTAYYHVNKNSWNAKIWFEARESFSAVEFTNQKSALKVKVWAWIWIGTSSVSLLRAGQPEVPNCNFRNRVTSWIHFHTSRSSFRIWQQPDKVCGGGLQILLNFVCACYLKPCCLVLFPIGIWSDKKFRFFSIDMREPILSAVAV